VLQIIGISFNLIIIRVSTNNTIDSQYTMRAVDHGTPPSQRQGSGGIGLQFVTGPNDSRCPSITDHTSTSVLSDASKEREIEFVHGDDENQKAPDSPEVCRVRELTLGGQNSGDSGY
jgi:hypothetical protein